MCSYKLAVTGRVCFRSSKARICSGRAQVKHACRTACVEGPYSSRILLISADTISFQRSTGELASYQKKLIRIDDHIGIAIAGLTSDARVLSNFMRQQAMTERMLHARPIPVNRVVGSIADRRPTLPFH